MSSFDKFFTQEQFNAYASLGKDAPRKQLEEHHALFSEAVHDFLYARRSELTDTVAGEGNRDVSFSEWWKSMVNDADAPDYYIAARKRNIGGYFLPVLFKYRRNAEKEGNFEDEFTDMVFKMNTGDFEIDDFMEDCYDKRTDERYKLQFQNWVPSYQHFNRRACEWQQVKDLEPEIPLHHLEVKFPTGEILVTDCFDLPGIKIETDYTKQSICSSEGTILCTTEQAQKDILHVFFADWVSEIWQGPNGDLIAGYPNEDDDEDWEKSQANCKKVASFETTRWWCTAVDRETLVNLVSDAVGDRETAIGMINDYVQEHAIQTFHVKPGKWNLYFSDNCQKFHDNFEPEDGSFDWGMQTAFVLSQKKVPTPWTEGEPGRKAKLRN